PGDCYKNGSYLEQAKDGEKEDELNQVEFVPPQGLILDAASSKVIEQSMKKGEEHKKSLETYMLRKVLSQKSWPTEEKKLQLA
ncbi:23860_t:CDS:2, partial [Cetraspora pellucida]